MKLWRRTADKLWEARVTCRVFERSDKTFSACIYIESPDDSGCATEFVESGFGSALEASRAVCRMVRRFIKRAQPL